ncbi:DNA repair protein RecO [Pseudokineococcus sp. 1T1Z-3]|uniref:DNA repair protein RecO n=1 Tax=Pseudokineococcus sp. 1T1Z-3 TaxID=3132745 RepID=UPI0030AC8AE4
MKLYRDEALVLRTQKIGEADRVITLLTRTCGRVRGVAKGVRRTGSRFGARLEPGMLVDVQLHQGRSLDVVTQVLTLGPYARSLGQDYPRYTAATAMLEVAERLTPEEREPATQQFLLLVGGLRALVGPPHAPVRRPPGLVLDAFVVRSLAVAGWGASFDACARCGEPGPHRGFAVAAGGAVCRSCRPPGAAAPAAATLQLLGALLAGAWDVAEASGGRERREASGLVAAYLQWHLERAVRSLPLVDRGEGEQGHDAEAPPPPPAAPGARTLEVVTSAQAAGAQDVRAGSPA